VATVTLGELDQTCAAVELLIDMETLLNQRGKRLKRGVEQRIFLIARKLNYVWGVSIERPAWPEKCHL
jgi:hypothetical protein